MQSRQSFSPLTPRRSPVRSRGARSAHIVGAILLALASVFGRAALTLASPTSGLTPPPTEVARATPRETVESLVSLADRGELASAAHTLDVRALDRRERTRLAPTYASWLAELVDHEVDPSSLPTTAAASAADGADVRVTTLSIGASTVDVMLSRERLDDGTAVWVFSRETVAQIPTLHANVVQSELSFIERLTPSTFRHRTFAGVQGWQWVGLGVFAAIAFALRFVMQRIGERIASGVLAKSAVAEADRGTHAERIGTRVGWLAVSIVLVTAIPALVATGDVGWWARRLGTVAMILSFGFVGAAIVDAVMESLEMKARADASWQSRGIRTKVLVLRRVLHVIGGIALAAAALVQFEPVREIGVSILASAGVAGIVIGFAAQRTLANLVAGLQLSFSQPLRIGDQVSIEGEFGTVEEITLSYVIIKVWDERRLVVPTARLLEMPFRNHTRVSAQQIGEVKVKCDFETDVATFRREAEAFVRGHQLFDGRVFAVQVVDTDERAMTLRILVSGENPSQVFDLRCAVREWAIRTLRKLGGEGALPRTRFARAHGFEETLAPEVADA